MNVKRFQFLLILASGVLMMAGLLALLGGSFSHLPAASAEKLPVTRGRAY